MNQIVPVEKPLTKNEIIELVAKRNDVKAFVFSKCDKHKEFQEDLYQELFMALLKLDEGVLQGIYKRGELHYKIIGIVKTMIESDRSTFYNVYIKPKKAKLFSESDEFDLVDISTQNREDKIEQFKDAASNLLPESIDQLYKWDREVLLKYLKEGNNQSKVSKKYKINPRYISEAMQKNFKQIRKMIENNMVPEEQIFPEFHIYKKDKRTSENREIEEYNKTEAFSPIKKFNKAI